MKDNENLIKNLRSENAALREALRWALNNLNPYDKPSDEDKTKYEEYCKLLKKG